MESIPTVACVLAFVCRRIEAVNHILATHSHGTYPLVVAEQALAEKLLREIAAEGIDNGNAVNTLLYREQSASLSLLHSIRPNVGRKEAKAAILKAKEQAARVAELELLREQFREFAEGWKSNDAAA